MHFGGASIPWVPSIAILLVFGLVPMEASSQDCWGALLWDLPDEHDYRPLDHIPRSGKRCHHVAVLHGTTRRSAKPWWRPEKVAERNGRKPAYGTEYGMMIAAT